MKFIADTHCHTVASTHAYNTVDENAAYASKIGLKALAITDHGPAMSDGAHPWHFQNLRILPRTIDGVLILRGAEVNITDFEGSIDLDEYTLNFLDWVIASFHHPVCAPSTKEDHTKAYLKIAQNPHVTVIGHCGTADYDYDHEKVVKAWKEYGKIVEINEGSTRVRKSSWNNCLDIAKLCKKYEVPIVVNSDAHYKTNIGDFQKSEMMLKEINFPETLILNADEERFFETIKKQCGIDWK